MSPPKNFPPPKNMPVPENLPPPKNMPTPKNMPLPKNIPPPKNMPPPKNFPPPDNMFPPKNMPPPFEFGFWVWENFRLGKERFCRKLNIAEMCHHQTAKKPVLHLNKYVTTRGRKKPFEFSFW